MPELMNPPQPAAPQPPTPAAPPTAPDAGAAKVETAPKSFKISYEDGETPTEVSFEDAQPSAEPSSFKFDQLEPLKESHADLYKALKAELSAKTRYSKHFKSPEEAAAAADRIGRIAEQLGDREAGLDGIERALARQTQVIQAAQSGDKATVEAWFKENPAGVSDFITHALEQLPTVDAKLAESISGQAFVKAIQQKDIYGQSALDALNALYAQVADKPEARKLLDRVAATVNQVAQASAYKPDRTAAQAAQLEKREAALFAKQIDLAADEVVKPAATRALQALTADMKGITSEERAEYRQFLVTEFYKALAKDSSVKAKYNELIKAKDQAGIVQLLKQSRAKVMNEAAKALYRAKLLNRQAVKDEAAAKAEAGSGGVPAAQGKQMAHWTGRVHPEKGPMADFDYDRMNRENVQAIDRQFYIKGDKRLWTW